MSRITPIPETGHQISHKEEQTIGAIDISKGLAWPKIDMHCHIWTHDTPEESADYLVECGERLGITEFWCSSPITGGRLASSEDVRKRNDDVIRAMRRQPGHIQGLCFVIPGHFDAALDEVKRCLDAGMVGVKLYNQYKIHDPAVWPLIELTIDRKIPILEHAGYLPAPEHRSAQPLTSHGADFAEVSRRYPEAMLINAHIGGGGDWEWTIRALRKSSPNVYVDVSGSNLDDGQVEFAVAELGAERVLFGTDGTMEGSVGKVLEAELTEEEQELIFWGNAARILAAGGKEPKVARDRAAQKGGAAHAF